MRGLRLLLACLAALSLTACWSRRELTEVSFSSLMGIDWEGGEYRVSMNILFPRAIGAAGEGNKPEDQVWTVSATGTSVDDTLSRLDTMLPRSLTLAHTRGIFYGEEMARQGISRTLDYLLRSVEIRPTAWIGVTPGTANDLLKARPHQEPEPGNGPAGYHFASIRRSSITPARRLVHVANLLQEEGIDLSLPLFRLADQPHPAPAGALEAQPDEGRELVYGGEGVFRADKLVEWVSPQATRGMLWAHGDVVHGAVTAPCPGEPHRTAVFRIRRGQGGINVQMRGGRPEAAIRVEAIADLNALPCAKVRIGPGDIRVVEEILEKHVRSEIEQGLQVMRETGSDFFGFGQQLFRRAPKAFTALENRWPELLRDMPVAVQVKARVPRLGQINRHFESEDGEQSPEP